MEYYALTAIFLVAFIFEVMVTGRLFLHRENLPVTGFMRWWAVGSLLIVSVFNMLGFLRLRSNYLTDKIDLGNYLQAGFALGTLSLIVWVYVFHLEKWRIDYNDKENKS